MEPEAKPQPIPFDLQFVPVNHQVGQAVVNGDTVLVLIFSTPVGTFGFMYPPEAADQLADELKKRASAAKIALSPQMVHEVLSGLKPNGK